MAGQQFQAWLMGLPAPARAVLLLVVVGLVVGSYVLPEAGIELEDVARWLPVMGVAVIVGGAAGVYGWRRNAQKQFERQMALNVRLAGEGMVRLVLPPRGGKETWKKVSEQAEAFAKFMATTARQFPDAHLALEIVGTKDGIYFQVWAPNETFQTVLQGLLASFPDAQLQEPKAVAKMPDLLKGLSPETQWRVFGLSHKPHYPLQSPADFPTESLAAVLATFARTPGMGRIGLQLILKAPPSNRWATAGQKEVEQQRAALGQVKGARPADRQRVEAMGAKADALTGMAATVVAFAEPASADRLNRLAMALRGVSQSRYNALHPVAQGQGDARVVGRHFDHKVGCATILSAEELATLWHLPRAEGDVAAARGVEIPPPSVVLCSEKPPFSPDHRILGRGTMRTGQRTPVKWAYGAPDYFDSTTHMAVIGATGSGKSTLISNLLAQDLCSGRCASVLIEPHRNLTLAVLAMTPPERETDVVWCTPAGQDRTFGLNPLDDGGNPRYRAAVGSAFIAALQRIVGGDFETMPRMKRILESTVEAVIEGIERPTLTHLATFLRHEEYRQEVIAKVRNVEVKAFWEEEFPKMGGSKQSDALQPVFNRISPLLVRDMTRHVLVQARTSLPMRALMDAGKTILIDVSAKNPEVGEQNASALGTLLVNAIWGAASSRVKGSYRLPAYLWIDEFHLFVTRDIEKMFAEARGFGLGVYIATQYYEQLPDWMQAAILNNVWTKLVGRTNGPNEAKLAARVFVGVDPQQILTLPSYTYVAQVTAEKQPTEAFTLQTLEPLPAELLWRAYAKANGGKVPTPAQFGAAPYDPFEGISPMSADEQATWRQHRGAMQGLPLEDQAAYLAGLEGEAYEAYCRLRRQADLEAYRAIVENRQIVPAVALGADEEKNLTPDALRRIKRIRALSSLAFERPRVEIEADGLRLRKTVDSAKASFDDLML